MQPKLDTMNHAQRATFARALYGNIRIKVNAVTAASGYAVSKGGAK